MRELGCHRREFQGADATQSRYDPSETVQGLKARRLRLRLSKRFREEGHDLIMAAVAEHAIGLSPGAACMAQPLIGTFGQVAQGRGLLLAIRGRGSSDATGV